jgi:hypothetical protein
LNLRSVAAACALTVGLSASSASMVTAQEHDASGESALTRLQHEKMLDYVRARGGLVAPPSIDAYVPRIKTPEVKALLERTSSLLLPALTADEQLREQALETVYRTMVTAGSCCPCSTASTCNDGLFCNGAELCVSGGCASGAAPCNDTNSCTNDSCTESTDTCTFSPVPPPPAVARLDLRRDGNPPTVAVLSWSAVSGANSYNIYRAASANLGGLACFQTGVTGTSSNDGGALPTVAFYFLVSSLGCSESSLADATAPSRPPPPGCP